ENFVHLERGGDCFDEHRRANRAARNPKLVLREIESVVPDPRLEMAIHFWQVEIRPGAPMEQLASIVKAVGAEIEQGAGDRITVNDHVLLNEMPAAGSNE